MTTQAAVGGAECSSFVTLGTQSTAISGAAPPPGGVLFLRPPTLVSRRIRVLHVVRNLNDGGMERVVADLARSADPVRFDVHIMTLGQFGRFAGGVGAHATLHHAPRMTKLSVLRPAALAAAIRRIAPDVVHSHSGSWYKVARAGRMAGVPVVYTEHGRHWPDPWSHRYLDRRAMRLTRRVVAVSQALSGYLTSAVGVPPQKIEVITNGIDVAEFDARRARVEAGPPRPPPPPRPPRNGRVVFGTLGRIEPVKGYDILLEAIARWPAQAPEVELLIGGDGSERPALESLARRLNIADRVRFMGWVSEPERFYPMLDAFVLSSRSEGTCISLLEAMAAGCPPVVTDVGGNREVLGVELRDWVARPGEAAPLLEKMVALASGALRDRLRGLARSRVLAAYDLARTAERYAAVYTSVV